MEPRIRKEIWCAGRKGAAVCLQVVEYETGHIVASAEDDKITLVQLGRALNREYPRHKFYVRRHDGFVYAEADPVGE